MGELLAIRGGLFPKVVFSSSLFCHQLALRQLQGSAVKGEMFKTSLCHWEWYRTGRWQGCNGHHACFGLLQVTPGLRIRPGTMSQAEARILTWDQILGCFLACTALICQRSISKQGLQSPTNSIWSKRFGSRKGRCISLLFFHTLHNKLVHHGVHAFLICSIY